MFQVYRFNTSVTAENRTATQVRRKAKEEVHGQDEKGHDDDWCDARCKRQGERKWIIHFGYLKMEQLKEDIDLLFQYQVLLVDFHWWKGVFQHFRQFHNQVLFSHTINIPIFHGIGFWALFCSTVPLQCKMQCTIIYLQTFLLCETI